MTMMLNLNDRANFGELTKSEYPNVIKKDSSLSKPVSKIINRIMVNEDNQAFQKLVDILRQDNLLHAIDPAAFYEADFLNYLIHLIKIPTIQLEKLVWLTVESLSQVEEVAIYLCQSDVVEIASVVVSTASNKQKSNRIIQVLSYLVIPYAKVKDIHLFPFETIRESHCADPTLDVIYRLLNGEIYVEDMIEELIDMTFNVMQELHFNNQNVIKLFYILAGIIHSGNGNECLILDESRGESLFRSVYRYFDPKARKIVQATLYIATHVLRSSEIQWAQVLLDDLSMEMVAHDILFNYEDPNIVEMCLRCICYVFQKQLETDFHCTQDFLNGLISKMKPESPYNVKIWSLNITYVMLFTEGPTVAQWLYDARITTVINEWVDVSPTKAAVILRLLAQEMTRVNRLREYQNQIDSLNVLTKLQELESDSISEDFDMFLVELHQLETSLCSDVL